MVLLPVGKAALRSETCHYAATQLHVASRAVILVPPSRARRREPKNSSLIRAFHATWKKPPPKSGRGHVEVDTPLLT